MLHILFITLPYFSATHTHTHTYASVFKYWGFPGSSLVKNPSANAGDIRDTGSIPGPGRSLGGGNGNPLQYPGLENPTDGGDWQATVHGVTESQTQRK